MFEPNVPCNLFLVLYIIVSLQSLISSCHSMSEMQLSSALYFLSGLEVGTSQLSDIRESVIRSSKQLNAGILQRLPVILILDKVSSMQ